MFCFVSAKGEDRPRFKNTKDTLSISKHKFEILIDFRSFDGRIVKAICFIVFRNSIVLIYYCRPISNVIIKLYFIYPVL